MRRLSFIFIALGAALPACATTVTPLQIPVDFPRAYYIRNLTLGARFDALNNVLGYGSSSRSAPCSGRGCQPVVTSQVYVIKWDVNGEVQTDTLCGTRRRHPPQDDLWLYQAGFDATNCIAPGSYATSVTEQINGKAYYVVAGSADGQYRVVNDQAHSYVVAF